MGDVYISIENVLILWLRILFRVFDLVGIAAIPSGGIFFVFCTMLVFIVSPFFLYVLSYIINGPFTVDWFREGVSIRVQLLL